MGSKAKIKEWKKVNLETAKIFLEQSDKRIEGSTKAISENSDKSFKLLIAISALVSSILIYLFNESLCNIIYSFTHRSALILLAPLIFCTIQLSRNLFRKKIYVTGFNPKNMMVDELMNDEHKDDEQTVSLIFALCGNIQKRIDNNRPINDKIIKRVSYCVFIAIISLILAPILSLLVGLLAL